MKTMKPYPKLSADHLLVKAGFFCLTRPVFQFVLLLFFIVASSVASAQLGVYAFTGSKNCPTQNPIVTSQPANAVFSSFSTVNADCKDQYDDQCNHDKWNVNATIDLNEYHQFSVTANSGYVLNLSSFSFRQFIKDEDNGDTRWFLRSSVDNYASDIGTGLALESAQTPAVVLPAANFTGVSNATFRIYLINSKDDSNEWTIDNVTLDGSVVTAGPPPADPGSPTSDSPQCAVPGVTLTANGTPPAGETWYWQTIATGTSTANSASTYIVTTSGS